MRRIHAHVASALIAATLLAACGDEVTEPPTVEAEEVQPTPEELEALVEGETGVRELKDGLVVETTVGGRGHAAENGDRLLVHYEGRVCESGDVFATTKTSGIPYGFTLGKKEVIPAWELALRGARPGSEHHLAVPASLAYAEEGLGKVPPGAALEFDIRVVSVE